MHDTVRKKEPVAAILFTEHFRKWRERMPLILQKALIFARRERKEHVVSLKFRKVTIEKSKRSRIFRIFTVVECVAVSQAHTQVFGCVELG